MVAAETAEGANGCPEALRFLADPARPLYFCPCCCQPFDPTLRRSHGRKQSQWAVRRSQCAEHWFWTSLPVWLGDNRERTVWLRMHWTAAAQPRKKTEAASFRFRSSSDLQRHKPTWKSTFKPWRSRQRRPRRWRLYGFAFPRPSACP